MLDGVVSPVERTGHLGAALPMTAENVLLPIPSEFVTPPAGFSAARGELSLALAVLSGTAGSLLGLPVRRRAGRV